MNAISIKQPFANLIIEGRKTLEIRTWHTHYRGPLIICACKRPVIDDLPIGVAIGIVDLVDIIEFEKRHAKQACTHWRADAFAWVLKNPRTIKHRKVKGQQRLFKLSCIGHHT